MVQFKKLLKNVFVILHEHNIHYQQEKLSTFPLHYKRFPSQSYCGAAGPVSKMTSQQENAVCSVSRCPDLRLQWSVSFVHGLKKMHHTRLMSFGLVFSLKDQRERTQLSLKDSRYGSRESSPGSSIHEMLLETTLKPSNEVSFNRLVLKE
jgi:hypothetical protein